ncbi:uncharacterized protein LOC125536663 isoform X2 [Triticum urartu]|uniref:uncharacterized protein LOC125536663 isoform X2 n=1 Tax=Triticum urartu TaxID=4572 RepID=UPI002043B029|nr:uncharacterized protein LOC125536663 isoform X2 [Triticum urartu]
MNETVTGKDRWTGIYCLAVPHGGRDAVAPCSVPMGLLCLMLPLVEFGTVSCCRLRRALGPSLLLIEPTSPVAGASSSRRSCCLPNLLLAASGCTISAVAVSFDSSRLHDLCCSCVVRLIKIYHEGKICLTVHFRRAHTSDGTGLASWWNQALESLRLLLLCFFGQADIYCTSSLLLVGGEPLLVEPLAPHLGSCLERRIARGQLPMCRGDGNMQINKRHMYCYE